MSNFDEMDDNPHSQPPGTVFHYQGGGGNDGRDTTLSSYIAEADFAWHFLNNRETLVLTDPKNLAESLSKADHVFEIERCTGNFTSDRYSGKDRFNSLPTATIDRRYFIPAFDKPHPTNPRPSQFEEVHVDDIFEEVGGPPLHDTGRDRAVFSLFCMVRDRDQDREPGSRFHLYFVRRLRNPRRGIVVQPTTPVLGRWPDRAT